MNEDFDATPGELARIACTTMVLAREGDPGHTVEAASFYAANIHGALLKVTPLDLTDVARGELIGWAAENGASGPTSG